MTNKVGSYVDHTRCGVCRKTFSEFFLPAQIVYDDTGQYMICLSCNHYNYRRVRNKPGYQSDLFEVNLSANRSV